MHFFVLILGYISEKMSLLPKVSFDSIIQFILACFTIFVLGPLWLAWHFITVFELHIFF